MSEEEPQIKSEAKNARLTVPLLVFLIAFLLRLAGMSWGMPGPDRAYSLHPDEPINLLYAQQAIEPSRLSFAPNFYNYGTLYLTATRIASDVSSTYGGKTPFSQLIGPRVLSALAGSLCAALVALFFARTGKFVAAWTAGLALATANGFVIHSRFATVDVLATTLLTGGLLVAMNVAEDGEDSRAPKRLLGAAALVGLAAACKYNMALGLLGVGVAAFALPAPRRVPTLILTGITTGFVFLLGVPGAITETESFLRDVRYELDHTAAGHGLVFEATAPGFLFHLGNLTLGCGLLTLILGMVGLILAARARERWAWLALAFAIPYFLLIGRAEVKFLRYVLPLIPLLAMGFGSLVQRLYERPGEPDEGRLRRRIAVAFAILAIAGIGPGGLVAALGSTAEMAAPDPRDAAGTYLREVARNGSVGIPQDPWFWTATIYPEIPAPRSVGATNYLGKMVSQTNPRVLRFLPENARERQDFDPRLLTDLKPDYVTESTLEIAHPERFQKAKVEGNPVAQALKTRYAEYRTILNRDYEIVRVFGLGRPPVVEDLEYVRPTVYVWKRKTH